MNEWMNEWIQSNPIQFILWHKMNEYVRSSIKAHCADFFLLL